MIGIKVSCSLTGLNVEQAVEIGGKGSLRLKLKLVSDHLNFCGQDETTRSPDKMKLKVSDSSSQTGGESRSVPKREHMEWGMEGEMRWCVVAVIPTTLRLVEHASYTVRRKDKATRDESPRDADR